MSGDAIQPLTGLCDNNRSDFVSEWDGLFDTETHLYVVMWVGGWVSE